MITKLRQDMLDVTKFDRDTAELQAFLLVSVCVAGKTAFVQERKLRDFLHGSIKASVLPFQWVKRLDKKGRLEKELRRVGMGQYRRIVPAFRGCAECNPQTITVEGLEAIKGIGPKTARFFLMHSRPNQRLAALDTHILAWMRDQGVKTPKATPTGKVYRELENTFLKLCDQRGKSPADLDMEIWRDRSRKEPAPSA